MLPTEHMSSYHVRISDSVVKLSDGSVTNATAIGTATLPTTVHPLKVNALRAPPFKTALLSVAQLAREFTVRIQGTRMYLVGRRKPPNIKSTISTGKLCGGKYQLNVKGTTTVEN